MSSKENRRHRKQRMKAKARKVYWYNTNPEKLADNMCCCSCSGCGNPRRHFKEITIQEKKQLEKESYYE